MEKTVAFMGPLIYDKSSSGNQDAVIKKAAAISFDSGVWGCASHGQLGLLWGVWGWHRGAFITLRFSVKSGPDDRDILMGVLEKFPDPPASLHPSPALPTKCGRSPAASEVPLPCASSFLPFLGGRGDSMGDPSHQDLWQGATGPIWAVKEGTQEAFLWAPTS